MKIKINKIYAVLFLAVLIVGTYFFVTDSLVLKKIAGYNVPKTTSTPSPSADGKLDFLTLPPGFSISVFADNLINPRVIAFDSKGRMFVSETKAGRVVSLTDADNDGLAEKKTVILENRKSPHGLAFYTDPKTKKVYLYVAETYQVSRFEYDVSKGTLMNTIGKNIANLPADGMHFTRTIAFGRNFREEQIIGGKSEVDTQVPMKLYISVGSSCDVCVETETWKRASILESDPEGKYTAEFAGGLRNSVFFAFHPETDEIWATDMGRDNLGDELPPDEINIVKVATEEHKFGARRYGWPFCYGDKIRDKTFNPTKVDRVDISADCSQTEAPPIEIPAHSAPLGLAFIDSNKWPGGWAGDLLVAYHGSWNRSEPVGYKIVRFNLDKNGNLQQPKNQDGEDFLTGFFDPSARSTDSGQAGPGQGAIIGRPVDLKFGPDGALYISDDSAGLIYRVVPTK